MGATVSPKPRASALQRGTAAVELALGMAMFITLLFVVIEVARFAHVRNLAIEATRVGARTAATCSPNATTDALIVTRMQQLLPQITSATQVRVQRLNAAGGVVCASGTCDPTTVSSVSVSLTGISVNTVMGTYVPAVNFPLPPSTSVLPREYMNSTLTFPDATKTDGSTLSVSNPACS